jgi:hypothetical protein
MKGNVNKRNGGGTESIEVKKPLLLAASPNACIPSHNTGMVKGAEEGMEGECEDGREKTTYQ